MTLEKATKLRAIFHLDGLEDSTVYSVDELKANSPEESLIDKAMSVAKRDIPKYIHSEYTIKSNFVKFKIYLKKYHYIQHKKIIPLCEFKTNGKINLEKIEKELENFVTSEVNIEITRTT